MIKQLKLLLLAGLLLILPVTNAHAIFNPESEKIFEEAILDIHKMDIDSAEKHFKKLVELYPEEPTGYFGEAIVAWARFSYESEYDDPEQHKLFSLKTEEAMIKGEKYAEEHSDNAYSYLLLGGIYGLSARLKLMDHSWLGAYKHGKKAVNLMYKAREIDPQCYDAYLGTGLYEYYSATLGGVVGVLSKLLLGGNAKTGIEELTLASEKAKFVKTAAKLLLVEIYTQTGSKYADGAKALSLAKEMRKQFPDHPLFQYVEIAALYESKMYNDILKECEQFIKDIKAGKKDYDEMYYPRLYLTIGTAYFAQKDFVNANKNYQISADYITDPNDPKRWAVWSIVRMGNILDLEGKREEAKNMYRKALKYEDKWELKDFIKAYIRHPYNYKKFPGQLPPP